MTPMRRVRRKLETTIAWMPASDSHHVVAQLRNARVPPLCLTQAVILGLEAQFATNPSPVPFGLLSGAWCVTHKTGEEYLLVDEVTPARGPISASDPLAELTDELRSLSSEATSRGRLVQGWYLGGMEDDLRLDPDALSVHLEIFPEPQHVLLLRNAPWGIARGGVFRYEQISDRLFPIPFFELLPERTRTGEQRRTAVRWVNYAASEPLQPLEPQSEPTERERDAMRGRDPVRFPPAPIEAAATPRLAAARSRSEVAGSFSVSGAADLATASTPRGPVRITFPVLLHDTDETSVSRRLAGRLVRLIGAVVVGLLLGLATYVAHGAYAASR